MGALARIVLNHEFYKLGLRSGQISDGSIRIQNV